MSALTDHYAILVAINRYPGIKNLYGPENDAEEFRKWLLDPGFGNLDPKNVRVIRSSDFHAVSDPDDANPTETQFKKVLNGWLRTKDDWQQRVGTRLYLFFAGHGFTTGNLANPALFTAQAQWGDPAHIAGLQYAAKIQNAGFFDEIVLIMDCCQDVLKATQVTDPTWTPPDRQSTSKVKFLQAYGAPRGQKAYETPQSTPVPHGYFSSCLIEALRDAPADAKGYVTARAVEQTLLDIWNERYLAATGYKPPFWAPPDMPLYRRHIPPFTISANPPVTRGGPEFQSPLPDEGIPMEPDSFEVTADSSQLLTEVAITSAEPGAQIQVFSAKGIVQGAGIGELNLYLAPGGYTARYRIGDAAKDVRFRFSGKEEEIQVHGSILKFSSPIPLDETSTHHEYHYYSAIDLEAVAAKRAAQSGFSDSAGTLLVFARDSAHEYAADWPMVQEAREGLRVRGLNRETGEPFDIPSNVTIDLVRGYSCLLLNDLSEGTYLVGVRRRERDNWYWLETPVTVASSWLRTEVYLDCVDDEDTGRRFDLDSASILVVSGTAEGALDTPAVRSTEVARLALLEGSPGVDISALESPSIDTQPMLALYSAYAMTFASSPDADEIQRLCGILSERWSQNSADVKILERWALSKNADPDALDEFELGPDEVPMISRGWELLRELKSNTRLSLNVQYSVGMWRVSSAFWTEMMVPERAVIPPWSEVQHQLSSVSTVEIRLQEGDQALERIVGALSKPNPTQSPVQQVVRRAILDAREAGEEPLLDEILLNTSQSLGLDKSIVRWSLDRLLMGAAIRMLGDFGKLISESITDPIGLEATEVKGEFATSSDDAEEEPPLTMTAGS